VKAELFLDNEQTDKELIISFTEPVHGACRLSQSRSVCDARVCRVVDALPSISQVASFVCEMSESFVSVIWHDWDVYTFRNHKDSGQKIYCHILDWQTVDKIITRCTAQECEWIYFVAFTYFATVLSHHTHTLYWSQCIFITSMERAL